MKYNMIKTKETYHSKFKASILLLAQSLETVDIKGIDPYFMPDSNESFSIKAVIGVFFIYCKTGVRRGQSMNFKPVISRANQVTFKEEQNRLKSGAISLHAKE